MHHTSGFVFSGGASGKEFTMSSSQSQPMSHSKLKKLIVLGLFAAIAFVATALLRIPMISFLKYDPKDIIIIIGGFIYGPAASMAIIVTVSVVEFFTQRYRPLGAINEYHLLGKYCSPCGVDLPQGSFSPRSHYWSRLRLCAERSLDVVVELYLHSVLYGPTPGSRSSIAAPGIPAFQSL
ncbi:MAG: ECF transporter S component [Clostridia bacterium]|nr:ECF transporter S component [Clostridia bacterium]